MKDFWKRKRNKRIAASALAVVMAGFLVWGLFPWQAAAAKNTVADNVTINKWHETLDNSTKNVGRICEYIEKHVAKLRINFLISIFVSFCFDLIPTLIVFHFIGLPLSANRFHLLKSAEYHKKLQQHRRRVLPTTDSVFPTAQDTAWFHCRTVLRPKTPH